MTDDGADAVGDTIAVASDRLYEELVAFVRGLRAAGADVPVDASIPAAEALAEVGIGDRERVRVGLRAALLTRPGDRELFDRLFDQFWSRLQALVDTDGDADEETETGGLEPPTLETPSGDESSRSDQDGTLDDVGGRRGLTERQASGGDETATATYSPVGGSEPVGSLAAGVDDDPTESATRRLTRALSGTPGRRAERAPVGRRVDVRSALRESIATGGTAMSLPKRRRKRTEVRGVVLADVSQSVLDVIDRDFLIRFLHALRSEWTSTRVFLFDTDVRDVSTAFDADSTAAAYAALERAEAEWGGGTRIGHALTTIRDRYPTTVDRRTVVLVVSDGLEMGDVSELADGVAWLAGRAPLVLWLNPLAAMESFEPTASGMAAALPHVDGVFAFADHTDVTEIARQLERYSGAEPLGYRHDRRRLA